MTLTSVGYGALLPPDENATEQTIAILCMVTSACFWVYTIGKASAVAATMNPEATQYRNEFDALNFFMRKRGLQSELRVHLRTYFHATRRLNQRGETHLLTRMSPLLRGQVALQAHRDWLQCVWWLAFDTSLLSHFNTGAEEHEAFIASLAMRLRGSAFVCEERIPGGTLCILRRGLVSRRWRFHGPGRVWGEDCIIERAELRDESAAIALTYVELLSLSPTDLHIAVRDFPGVRARLRAATLRITMARVLIRAIKNIPEEKLSAIIDDAKLKVAQERGESPSTTPRQEPAQLEMTVAGSPRAAEATAEDRLRVVRNVALVLGVESRGGALRCTNVLGGAAPVTQQTCEAIATAVRAEKRMDTRGLNGGGARGEDAAGIGRRLSTAMRHVITGESLEA